MDERREALDDYPSALKANAGLMVLNEILPWE
jgi:hypothetical protein